MSKIDDLLAAYQKQISLPWSDLLSPQEKVWFCIYDPSQERRLRKQMEAFAIVTQETGHEWIPIDIAFLFEQFLASNEYQEKYYRNPKLVNYPPLAQGASCECPGLSGSLRPVCRRLPANCR